MTASRSVAPSGSVLRVLVPLGAGDESRWGIRYAQRRKEEGVDVEVVLLHVGEPVTQWQVLRFRTQREIARFQAERARFFIDDATRYLAAAGIPSRGMFREGELVFAILDTAEELKCDEIAMPSPPGGLASLFSRDIVDAVARRQRHVPVVTVNEEGIALQLPVESQPASR